LVQINELTVFVFFRKIKGQQPFIVVIENIPFASDDVPGSYCHVFWYWTFKDRCFEPPIQRKSDCPFLCSVVHCVCHKFHNSKSFAGSENLRGLFKFKLDLSIINAVIKKSKVLTYSSSTFTNIQRVDVSNVLFLFIL
jgi:hypothetical protein